MASAVAALYAGYLLALPFALFLVVYAVRRWLRGRHG